ncbi:MAG: bifunctional DNA primase/polymerase [Candidatus Omnitrophica bacterium]|nr:bifunctional DNA primase/polymerase [Candidatus Omnitrophota bacterium]
MEINSPHTSKTAALDYIGRGWSIVPVGRNKIPFVPWKEYQQRLPSVQEIDEWLEKWPTLNWAVVTGAFSGVVVLDIDPRHNGNQSMKELVKTYGLLPSTPKVTTGGGGRHYYFKHPGFFVKSVTLKPGVEIKGDASLVTLPPSVHQSGRAYEWERSLASSIIKPMPGWLLESAKRQAEDFHTPIELGATSFVEGTRNHSLASIAGVLRVRGLAEAAIVEALSGINRVVCIPPLEEDEVQGIARSVSNYPSKIDSAAFTYVNTAETKWLTSKELSERELEEVEWIWRGYLGAGIVTLFSARPKVGKTTLLFHLLKATLAKGKFLGHETFLKKKILLLSEEPLSLLKRRIEKHGLESDDFLIIPRFRLRNWAEAVAYVNHGVVKEGVELVVIDTVAAFWGVQNENDATHIMEALRPIQEVVQKHKVALLLIHHLRKADGEEGTAHRGSGALVGAVEIVLEMGKRPSSKEQRLLNGIGRYEETPSEVVIELREDGYHALGSPDQTSFEEVRVKVLAVVSDHMEAPIDSKAIEDRLPEPKPKKTNLKDVLANLTSTGLVEQIGKGVRNSPYLYRKSSPLKPQEKTRKVEESAKETVSPVQGTVDDVPEEPLEAPAPEAPQNESAEACSFKAAKTKGVKKRKRKERPTRGVSTKRRPFLRPSQKIAPSAI